MDLEARRAGQDLLDQRSRRRRIAFAEIAEIERHIGHCFQHALKVENAGAFDADGLRTGATTNHGGKSGILIFVELLNGIEMRMNVEETGRTDHALNRENIRIG